MAETLGHSRRLAGFLVHGNRDNASGGDEPPTGFLEYGEFESKTAVSNFACTSVNVQGLVEKCPSFELAIRFDIKKINSISQKIVIFVPDRLEVFDQPHIEICEVVAEKDMSLHVGFNVSNLYGGKEFELIFQFCPPSRSKQVIRPRASEESGLL